MTDEEKSQTWSDRVRLIAQHEHGKGRDLNWQEFINYWSRIWPNQAVKWFMPNKGQPMRSLLRAEGICKVSNDYVRIKGNSRESAPLPKRRPETPRKLPEQRRELPEQSRKRKATMPLAAPSRKIPRPTAKPMPTAAPKPMPKSNLVITHLLSFSSGAPSDRKKTWKEQHHFHA